MNPCQAFFTELRAFSNGLENDCRELVAMAKQKPSYESSVQGYRGFGFIDHLASLTGEIDANLRVMRSVSDDSNRMLHLDSIMEVCAAILKENEKLIDRVENKLEAYGYQRPKKTRMALYSEALDGQAQQNLGMANVMGGLRSNNNNNLNTSDEMMSGLDDSFDNGNHHNSSAYGVAPMSPATPDIVQAKRDIRHDQYSKPLFQSATAVAPRTPTLDDYGISASALALINQGPPSPIEGGTATAGGQFHTNRWAEPVEMDFDTPHKNRYQPHQGTAFSAVTPGTYRRFVDESQVAAAAMANINAAGDQAQGAAMLQGRPPSMSFQPIAFPDLNDAQFQHNSQQQQQQPQLVQPQQHRFSIFPTTATAFNAFPSQQQQMQQQQQYHHHQQQEQQQHQMQQFQQLQQQQHQQQQQQFQPFQQVFLQQQHQQPVTPFQQQVATGVAPSSGTTTGMFTGPSPAVAASFPNAASNVNTTSTTPIPPTPSSVSPFTVPAVNATPFPSATMTSSRGDGTRSSTPLPVVDGGAFSGAVPSICNSNININNNANINDNNNNNNVNDAATTATTITNTNNNNNNNSLDRSDIQDNLYPLMEPVSAEEFEAVPLFLKSQFTLQFVNETISAINDFMTDKRFGDGSNFLTQEELRDELALGTKTKAVILLLVRLNRFSSQKRLAGEETVYFLRGAH